MTKLIKRLAIGLIIIGVCLIFIGFASSFVAKQNKGVSISTAYEVNGELRVLDSYSGNIGEDSSKVEMFDNISKVSYVVGIILVIVGGVTVVTSIIKNRGGES